MDFTSQIDRKVEWKSACDDALRDVATACRRTNQAGEVTLKLKVEPNLDKDGQTILTMRLGVAVKAPRPSPGIQQAYLVTDDDDNAVDLSKDHPQQLSMFRQMAKDMEGDQ